MNDLLMTPLSDSAQPELFEVPNDDTTGISQSIASQIQIDNWHAAIGNPNCAAALALQWNRRMAPRGRPARLAVGRLLDLRGIRMPDRGTPFIFSPQVDGRKNDRQTKVRFETKRHDGE
ncbi:hypothetical protein M3I53_22595 [Paraburkholderia sp. CNPSo 3272]|uniref:hypothetical protein n=1 Tax=Paraburkholderia sp. CNPSo 3272 TaxID=2940931 RepID=UPI0020B7CD68|nr:hypothetical protein [Paraburkholderia sp. CNPSo 3272]MCP3725886.1 hypothetical protein [Paraburkholderia sp. CNPSo 3272]